MKKLWSFILVLTLAVSMLSSYTASAQNDSFVLTMQIGNPIMNVNGASSEIDPGRGTIPVVENGRTLVPIRAIIEAMGGTVGWNGTTQTVTLTYGSDKIVLNIDSAYAYLNGAMSVLDVAPKTINERTVLPIRYIAESFKFGVEWDGNTQTIKITKNGSLSNELSAEEIYVKCSPSVFYIEVYNENGSIRGSGSGFFIDEKGTAVTNFHVIDGCSSARITTSDNQKTYDVLGVYNYNIAEDWAVIKVDCANQKALELGESNSLIGGATVYAIGSPLGLQNTISKGLISNPNRYEDGINYIQISAAISSGSSGGALLDVKGRVIGITSASYVNGQNLNLAIPISYVNIDTSGTIKQFEVLEKTVDIEDPVKFLQDFLVEYGTADALTGAADGTTLITYSVNMEDVNGALFTINYATNTGCMYIEKEYSTNFNKISANLYLSGAGTNEEAAKASFIYRNNIESLICHGFVIREFVTDPEYFSFYSMLEMTGKTDISLSQAAGEEICHGMILDIIDAADYIFSYYNLPITMRDFGYIY